MTSPGTRLAWTLREAQWKIDHAAHYMPYGEISADQCSALADDLEEVARQLRLHATRAQVIQGQTR